MDNNCTLNAEKIEDGTLENVSGGGAGHIDFIICHICGYNLPVKGQHNFVSRCPKCGAPMKTW